MALFHSARVKPDSSNDTKPRCRLAKRSNALKVHVHMDARSILVKRKQTFSLVDDLGATLSHRRRSANESGAQIV